MQQSVRGSVLLEAVATVVPSTTRTLRDDEGALDATKLASVSKNTGIANRRVATTETAADLCARAARELLDKEGIDVTSIDALVFVTQTPDQMLPATACTLQHRLGLPSEVAAFDVNLGCSGYVYGLWLASKLLVGAEPGRRVLLLAGDTISRIVSREDMSTAPIFGDAGSATLLVRDDDAPDLTFVMGTDGAGAEHLIVPAGGFRKPSTEETRALQETDSGRRSDEHLFMNGAEVFNFTLKRVAPMLQQTLDAAGWAKEDVTALVPHQANAFMLKHIARKMKMSSELVLSLDEVGNTSSASIPLALVRAMHDRIAASSSLKTLLAGFGVGWSWGAVACDLGQTKVHPLVEESAE